MLERAQDGPKSGYAAQQKWGNALLAGFQAVPNILVLEHKQMKLDPVDVLILLNLNMHWWSANDHPYPKASLIAERVGVTKRTIERRLKTLEKKKLIERLPVEMRGRTPVRRFRLAGLVEELSKRAEKNVAARGRPTPAMMQDSD